MENKVYSLEQVEWNGMVFEDDYVLEAYKHFGKLTPRHGRRIEGKEWADKYKEHYNITVLAKGDKFPTGDNVVYCTSCCAEKTETQFGTPIEIYASKITQSFMKTMEKFGKPYAILSGEKGFIKHDEVIETYDSGSTSLVIYEEEYMMDAINIDKQLRENNWDTVVFAYGSPLRAESFLRVFEHVMKLNPELKVYYTTTMNNSDFKEAK